MRSFLLILCLLASKLLFSQKNDTLKKYLDANFSLTSRSKMVYPAIAFKVNNHWLLHATYPDNSPLLTAYYKDEKLEIPDGPYTLYYPNRIRARSGRYYDGYRVGVWKYWYENGRLRDSGLIINNELVGTWHTWHDNGNLFLLINYASPENSRDSGLRRKGSLRQKTLVTENDQLAGIKEGTFMRFHENGLASDSGQFTHNKKTGLWKIWFANGQLEAKGHFSNDSLQGEWNWYRDNGMPATKEHYRHNKLVSLQCFDENGKYAGEFCSVLKPPVPIGDYTDFNLYLLDNIILPKVLRHTKLKGTVIIKCNISKNGKLTAVSIEGCRYESLRKEIEKFFHAIKEWSPAILHNRPVDYSFEYVLPLSIVGNVRE